MKEKIWVEITKSGNNFVVTDQYGAVSRPYLNYCDIEYRNFFREHYKMYNIHEHWDKTYKELMFQGYDYGWNLGGEDPTAKMFLKFSLNF